MEKVDLKDRRILYELDLNSRQSLSKIGKKVGLHRNIVLYRINKLKEKGIIKNFYTVIDSSKLGYKSFRFYIVYQRTTPEIEKEIIDYFVKNKHIWVVASLKGRFDLAVVVWVKDINDFYSFWRETLNNYRDYFESQIFSVYLQSFNYRYSFLLKDEYKKSDRAKFQISGGGKRLEIDDLDYKILKLLAEDARIPTTEIAKKLNLTAITVNNRIKNLIDLDVIQGFRVDIDLSKLGYYFYKADVTLMDYKREKQISNYIMLNPHLNMIDQSAGHADLELDFIVENVNQFHKIMEDLIVKFPNTIQNYKYYQLSETHKLKYIPEE